MSDVFEDKHPRCAICGRFVSYEDDTTIKWKRDDTCEAGICGESWPEHVACSAKEASSDD